VEEASDESREEESNMFGASSGEVEERRPSGQHREGERSYNDFKLYIPKFEGQLDPNLFLDWLQNIERIFEYKDVLDDKNVNLLALKLRKYASIRWSNVMAKRARKRKEKIKTREK